MTRTLFVTGTDTGCGKTTVAAGILFALRAAGARVEALKPVETGCPRGPRDDLVPEDALLLRAAAGTDAPLDDVCPIRYHTPVAPAVAARAEGRPLDVEALFAARDRLLARDPDLLLVEGAGGLLVPYTDDLLAADLIPRFAREVSVLIVGRATLGTINHTLLTLAECRRRGLSVAGVVLSQLAAGAAPDSPTNAAEIERWGHARVIGAFPHVHEPARRDPAALGHAARTSIDLNALAGGNASVT